MISRSLGEWVTRDMNYGLNLFFLDMYLYACSVLRVSLFVGGTFPLVTVIPQPPLLQTHVLIQLLYHNWSFTLISNFLII